MNSRIIAPKPQQIASRNDIVKISNSRPALHGHPRRREHSSARAQREHPERRGAACGSPSIRNRIDVHGTPFGSWRTARLK